MSAQVPVGAIVAYAADETNHILDLNWMLCDGSPLRKVDFPDLFSAIGYANGGEGDNFLLPDLQGRFLRGADAHNTPGKTAGFTTANPGFMVTLKSIPTGWNWTDLGAGAGSWHMDDWNDGSVQFPLTGGDKETRPVNVYFQYIIKTKPDSKLPIGSVIPYAGSDTSAGPSNAWLYCDGNEYRNSAYRDLANEIGSRFSASSSSSRFNVPKLFGLFIRGVDPRATRDPDALNRSPPPDNTPGPVVGSLQEYGTAPNGFHVDVPHCPRSVSLVLKVDGHDNLYDHIYTNEQYWSGGALETRPSNAYVQYYIRAASDATNDPDQDPIPVGAIIAIPGASVPPIAYWAATDGKELSKTDYPDLYNILDDAWGKPTSSDNFKLPDLQGLFLRGTDPTKPGAEDPWGDPDRDKRDGTGTGSTQKFATGPPKQPFAISINNPHDDQNNADLLGPAGNKTAAFNTSLRGFPVSGGDEETAPANLRVAFYIKIKTNVHHKQASHTSGPVKNPSPYNFSI